MAKSYGFSGATAEELREAYDIFNAHLKKNDLRELMFRGPIQEADMKKAFRKLALIYHPDRNPGNEATIEERQKEVFNAFNLFKNYFNEHEQYDPTSYRTPHSARPRPGPRHEPPPPPKAKPASEDKFWQKGASLKRDQEFNRAMEQYASELRPEELQEKLHKSFELAWKLLEQSGHSPRSAELSEIRARRLATRYNLQAELSYAQRRYDKSKLEYLQEAVFLVWEASFQDNRSAFDEKLLLSSVRAAFLKSAKSAHYDGKGGIKALWLLSQHPQEAIEQIRHRLGLQEEPWSAHSWKASDLDEDSTTPKKGILDELSEWGSGLKHNVLKGIRKIINP